MPRKKLLRRFEPRYGIPASAVEAEAKWLGREVEDHEILAPSDLAGKRSERYKLAHQAWEHLSVLLENLPEHDRRVLQCLLFRDIYHILELYRTHMNIVHPQNPAPAATVRKPVTQSDTFSEWLFGPPQGKES